MGTSDKSVLAVVINYNGGAEVLRCLDSLLAQTYPSVKVIVVDNASTDGSADRIGKDYPAAVLIRHPVNSGWGVGCNIGMAAADSEYVALINNDAWLDRDCISEMVKAIELRPEYGSCASKILTADGKMLEVCGLNIVADGSSCGRGRLRSPQLYSETEEVFCANDCCCLYKRAMVDEIGGYDPDFFIYCDETDMGFRHQIAGWKCVYTPKALAYHSHSLTAGSYSPFKAFYVERNRIFILLKYFPPAMMAAGFALSFWRYLLQVQIAAVRKQGALARYLEGYSLWQGLWVLMRAHGSALAMAPTMFRRRSSMAAIRKIGRGDFRRLFRAHGISVRAMAAYE